MALLDPKSVAAKSFAPDAAKWIVGGDGTGVIGRMKFCRPIFKAIYKVDPDLAVIVYKRKKNAFHPIARKNIERVSLLSSSPHLTNIDTRAYQDLGISFA